MVTETIKTTMKEFLKEMVRDVNHAGVLPHEILSDNVYY